MATSLSYRSNYKVSIDKFKPLAESPKSMINLFRYIICYIVHIFTIINDRAVEDV